MNSKHHLYEAKKVCLGDGMNEWELDKPCGKELVINEDNLFAHYLFTNVIDNKPVHVMETLFICPNCGCITKVDSNEIPGVVKIRLYDNFFDNPILMYQKKKEAKTLILKR